MNVDIFDKIAMSCPEICHRGFILRDDFLPYSIFQAYQSKIESSWHKGENWLTKVKVEEKAKFLSRQRDENTLKIRSLIKNYYKKTE